LRTRQQNAWHSQQYHFIPEVEQAAVEVRNTHTSMYTKVSTPSAVLICLYIWYLKTSGSFSSTCLFRTVSASMTCNGVNQHPVSSNQLENLSFELPILGTYLVHLPRDRGDDSNDFDLARHIYFQTLFQNYTSNVIGLAKFPQRF
jgi:hypothetical protein